MQPPSNDGSEKVDFGQTMREVVSKTPSLAPSERTNVNDEDVNDDEGPIDRLADGIDRLADETQSANREGRHTKRLQFMMLAINLAVAAVVVYCAMLVLEAVKSGVARLDEVSAEARASVSVNKDVARSISAMVQADALDDKGDQKRADELREEAAEQAIVAEVKAVTTEVEAVKKQAATIPSAVPPKAVQILNERLEKVKRKARAAGVEPEIDHLEGVY